MKILKELQLCFCLYSWACPSLVTLIRIAYTVLLAQGRHELRQALVVGLRQECPIFVTLTVAFYQMREFFFQEGQEDGRRAGPEKQRIGEAVPAANRSSSVNRV